ncbi:unnamed protein product [Mytilus coruscus]|uniref:TIR domain-containing protein n=1 Tax=Mytilus coruscus TaxID=42192 RepID=A0A6J8BGH4_MYTCO|nr:unnamed protein product [Mytilus coruscus]
MNIPKGLNTDGCLLYYLLSFGYMTVIDHQSGDINNADCLEDTFQPTPYKSNTQCGCALMKSTCNDIGQVISTNGSTDKDRTCRCDYLKGYTYVTMPDDRCNCSPKGENCTCKLIECPNGSRLSPDYVCIENARYLKTNFSCQVLNEHRMSQGNTSNPKDETFPEDTDNSVTGIAVPIFTICILLSSFVSFSFGAFAGVNKWFSKIRDVTIKCCSSRNNKGTNKSGKCEDDETHSLQNETNQELNLNYTSSNFEYAKEDTTVDITGIQEECGEQSKTNKQRMLPSRSNEDVYLQDGNTYQDANVKMHEELDVAVINVYDDKDAAEQYINHLKHLCGNDNIYIELLHNAMKSGKSFTEVLKPCRHILIFVSKNFTLKKFKDEKYFQHLEKKFFGESFNIERVKIVYSDFCQIPEELVALNTIPYTAESIESATYIARMRNYFSVIQKD